MERAFALAIDVDAVLPDEPREPVHVQVRVHRLERVEGPVDELDSLLDHPLPLSPLELLAQPRPAVLRKDAEHMGVMEHAPPVPSGEPADEPHHPLALEGADEDSPVVVHGDEVERRNRVGGAEAPDVHLELGAGVVVRRFLEIADLDGHGRMIFPRPEAVNPLRRPGPSRSSDPLPPAAGGSKPRFRQRGRSPFRSRGRG